MICSMFRKCKKYLNHPFGNLLQMLGQSDIFGTNKDVPGLLRQQGPPLQAFGSNRKGTQLFFADTVITMAFEDADARKIAG